MGWQRPAINLCRMLTGIMVQLVVFFCCFSDCHLAFCFSSLHKFCLLTCVYFHVPLIRQRTLYGLNTYLYLWTLYELRVGFRSNKTGLTLTTLGKIFSRWYFEIVVIYFPENRNWNFMQTKVCIKCQILFSGKNKKKYHQFVVCWISPVSCKC